MIDSPEANLPSEDDAEPAAEGEESDGNARQERMIDALLENFTQEKAAAAQGISTVTLWRQMQNAEFAAAFRKARRQAVSLSVARLQQATGASVATLLRIMSGREAPAASRIRAADVVLQGAFRGMEIEDIEVPSGAGAGGLGSLKTLAHAARNRGGRFVFYSDLTSPWRVVNERNDAIGRAGY